MKAITVIIIIFSIFIFYACGSSDDNTDNNYEFIDQDLQGKIGGTDWIYQSGSAEIDSFNNNSLDITIYDIDPDGGDACDVFAYFNADNIVMMSVPNQTGSYTLGNSRTITLYDGYTNYILTEGKLEILTVDTGTIVTGRIAAGYDSNNTVIGNFSVTYCP